MSMPTRLILGLDYELFFGRASGSVERCLVEPSEAISKVALRYGLRITFFVDAGMLVRMQEQSATIPAVAAQYAAVTRNLARLREAGHDLQLHIHPHWEDSYHDGERWCFDSTRYRLHQFSDSDKRDIVRRYSDAIAEVAQVRSTAYRAGGWCAQPFDQIAESLAESGIMFESSVMPGAYSADSLRPYDYRSAPRKAAWRFDSDPVCEVSDGRFIEVPITVFNVGPVFYWKYLVSRKLAAAAHQSFGDGDSIRAGASSYLKKLIMPRQHIEASVDGFKSSLLLSKGVSKARAGGLLNIMGHPKALTPYSLTRLDQFFAWSRFSPAGFDHELESFL